MIKKNVLLKTFDPFPFIICIVVVYFCQQLNITSSARDYNELNCRYALIYYSEKKTIHNEMKHIGVYLCSIH